jgi:hypothetical protein
MHVSDALDPNNRIKEEVWGGDRYGHGYGYGEDGEGDEVNGEMEVFDPMDDMSPLVVSKRMKGKCKQNLIYLCNELNVNVCMVYVQWKSMRLSIQTTFLISWSLRYVY